MFLNYLVTYCDQMSLFSIQFRSYNIRICIRLRYTAICKNFKSYKVWINA